MNDTYYEFGTAADRWDRAQMFFEAKEYLTAARILDGLVDEAPDLVAPRCCWRAPTTTRRGSRRPRQSCSPSWNATRSRSTRGSCSVAHLNARGGPRKRPRICGWPQRWPGSSGKVRTPDFGAVRAFPNLAL